MQRDYVEFLAGKLILKEKFSGAFNVRRDKNGGSDGLAISQDTDKGFWKVGLFKRGKIAMLQNRRRKESISLRHGMSFLPISMPITSIALLRLWDMACSFVFGAPCQIRHWRGRSTAGPSH
jgi:hypothetical protein